MSDLSDILLDACRGTLCGPDKVELYDQTRGQGDWRVSFGTILAALRDGPGAEMGRLRKYHAPNCALLYGDEHCNCNVARANELAAENERLRAALAKED